MRHLVNISLPPAAVANNNLVIQIREEQVAGIKNQLDEWKIGYENIVASELFINLASVDTNTVVFFSELNFRQGAEKLFVTTTNLKKDIAVIVYGDTFLVYDHLSGKTTNGSGTSESSFLIQNALYYYEVLELLKSNLFADYINTTDKEIVLYSGTKGIKRINIPDFLPEFDEDRSLMHDAELFIERYTSPDFRVFFKNRLFELSGMPAGEELKEIMLSLGSIIREADNNLQLYLKNFSFEKLKNDLQKEKEQYFFSLRDILGKNMSQIVAVPVSFAASVFATYTVKDVFILLIILFAFILYSAFTIYLQKLYLKDIREIEDAFQTDFRVIAERSGLADLEIDAERFKISRRISDIRKVVTRFRLLLILLTIIFTLFICNQIFPGILPGLF
ncbi:MAG: hypothetical protein H7Y03_03780 [Chitinophagaceae bacterium]|nr:hypothetical protein [Chitinophagaceae bacterium]